jgi:hypothetical protein
MFHLIDTFFSMGMTGVFTARTDDVPLYSDVPLYNDDRYSNMMSFGDCIKSWYVNSMYTAVKITTTPTYRCQFNSISSATSLI